MYLARFLCARLNDATGDLLHGAAARVGDSVGGINKRPYAVLLNVRMWRYGAV